MGGVRRARRRRVVRASQGGLRIGRARHGVTVAWFRAPGPRITMSLERHKRERLLLSVALVALYAAAPCAAQATPRSGTTTFVLDGNRIYATLAFVRPNGSLHRA